MFPHLFGDAGGFNSLDWIATKFLKGKDSVRLNMSGVQSKGKEFVFNDRPALFDSEGNEINIETDQGKGINLWDVYLSIYRR